MRRHTDHTSTRRTLLRALFLLQYVAFFTVQMFYNLDICSQARTGYGVVTLFQKATGGEKVWRAADEGKPKHEVKVRLNKRYQHVQFDLSTNIATVLPPLVVAPYRPFASDLSKYLRPNLLPNALRGPPAVA